MMRDRMDALEELAEKQLQLMDNLIDRINVISSINKAIIEKLDDAEKQILFNSSIETIGGGPEYERIRNMIYGEIYGNDAAHGSVKSQHRAQTH